VANLDAASTRRGVVAADPKNPLDHGLAEASSEDEDAALLLLSEWAAWADDRMREAEN
jgi:hypothetical protein